MNAYKINVRRFMAYRYSKQLDVYDTSNEITTMNGVSGQHAYAEDTKTIFIHNGATWVTGYSLGKIIGTGNAPTATVGALAGANASITLAPGSTNLIGTITIKTGTTINTTGTLFSVTLADSASYPTSTVPIITAASGNAVSFLSSYYVVTSTTGFSVLCSGVTINSGTNVIFNYFNPGY